MTLDPIAEPEFPRVEMWPISQDPKTRNQVAAILLIREMKKALREIEAGVRCGYCGRDVEHCPGGDDHGVCHAPDRLTAALEDPANAR